jgi:hypothetical protein
MTHPVDERNAAEAAYWNGPGGQRWLNRQPAQDALLTPVSGILLERVRGARQDATHPPPVPGPQLAGAPRRKGAQRGIAWPAPARRVYADAARKMPQPVDDRRKLHAPR